MQKISNIEYDCTGCEACVQICKKSAIRMQQKSDGFMYPVIDNEKCVDCGLCTKICPANTEISNSNTQIPYLAYNLNIEDRLDSSSGGIFSVIARHVLQQGGIVYGAAYDKSLTVQHISIDNISDLQKIRGSKYVQSVIGESFIKCKQNLLEGKLVYFTGTPCQIAGLKTYLQHDYDNLITSDLICHGIPSGHLFKEYISFLESKHNIKIHNYKFRSKKRYGQGYDLEIITEVNHKKSSHFLCAEAEPFFYGFWKNLILRESCYRCKYSRIERVSDITLADFWTAKKFFPKIKTSNGLSLILANSEVGKHIIDCVQENMKIKEIHTGIKSIGQAHLDHPVHRPQSRDILKQGLSYKQLCTGLLHIPLAYKLRVKLRNFVKTVICYKYWK